MRLLTCHNMTGVDEDFDKHDSKIASILWFWPELYSYRVLESLLLYMLINWSIDTLLYQFD
jgi:hypothetical protein